MRIARTILGLIGCSLLFSMQAALSQGGNAGFLAGPEGPGAHGFWGRGRMNPVTGQPYSGVRTTSFTETLANGTTINRSTTTKEARDSNGRIYRETQVTMGNGTARTLYTVFDPANHVSTNWRSDGKQAVVTHLPDFGARGQGHRAFTPQDGQTPAASFNRRGPAPAVEQLGTKTIEGVNATGTRSTVTFPAGAFGNSQPITVTHERWVNADLGTTVLETDNDPRNGVRTIALTNIQRNEPDPTLFQPPQGYTTVERTRGPR